MFPLLSPNVLNLPPLPSPCAVYRSPNTVCWYMEPLDKYGDRVEPTNANPGSYECNKVGTRYKQSR